MRVHSLFRSRLVHASGLIVLLCLFAVPSFAADTRFWQLTFIYTPQTLALERAAQIPPMAKAVRTPGLDDAVATIDFDVEWLDAQGQVIMTVPATLPFRGRTVMGEGPQIVPHKEHVMPSGALVLRVPGPENATAVAQVRLVLRQAETRAKSVSPGPPPIFQQAQHTLDVPRQAAAVSPAPGTISATKVRNTGSDGNRFVIAILGDGFTAANLGAGAFSSKVTSFLTTFFGVSPWNIYQNVVNVYRVDIESAQSGADYQDAAPAEGGTLVDTYLNAAFWTGGTERCLYLNSTGEARAFAAADELVGVGVWDEVLVFVNATKYGGCGGSVGVSSLNSSADEIQIHEFGHSFGGLADEYDYGSTGTNCTSKSQRNIDCSANFPSVKWDVWVTPGAPIPTPDTSTYNNTVGAFEGADYQVIGVFRPKRDCRMRTLGVSFCPICKEGHILKLFEKFRIVDSASPAFGLADVPSAGTQRFSVAPVNVSSFTYRWFLNNALLPNATNVSLTISNSQVTFSNMPLRLEVTHFTTNVRAQPIVQSNYTWALRLAPVPAIRINDVSIAEGNSGTRTARFSVTLSFAHTAAVSVDYNTTNASATAGSDYAAVAGTLMFPPGVTTNFIDVPVFGDTTPEGNEVFFVNLSNPTNAVLADHQGAGLILDGDTPPVVILTNPPPGLVLFAPATISLGAEAYDAGGVVKKVAFYAGNSIIGQVTNGPITLVWSNVPAGTYLLRAIATDDASLTGTSAPVSLTVVAGGTQSFSFIAFTNLWRYDQTTNNYGTAWKEVGYDDSAWQGPSPALFYNETATLPQPKLTPLLLTNGARLRTYYFRTSFVASNALDARYQLIASNLVDDGAVFYLNGTEANRLRITGTPTRTTLANAQPPGGDATAIEVLYFPPSAVVAGTNVMAVEVHQQADSSSDVVFGMSLQAVQGFAPVIIDTNAPADQLVLQSRPLLLSINATGAPPPSYQWFRNGSPIANATSAVYQVTSMTSGNAGTYFVRVTNLLGAVDSRVATISYTGDTTGPGILYALGSNVATRVFVAYAEPVSASGVTVGNYTMTAVSAGTNLSVTGAVFLGTTGVVLTTAARLPNVNYVLTVNNVRDSLNNLIADNTQVPIASELFVLNSDNQAWRYFQLGAEPGAGWTEPLFDDAADGWANGTALFDAKTPAGRTTVGPNNVPVRTMMSLSNTFSGDAQTLAYYFRAPFYVPGYPAGSRLRLRALVDDGAIFYLNGSEVYRLRMAAGPADYNTLAAVTQGDAQNIFEGPFSLPTDALVAGTNVFAVEVHQASATSSDASFAAQLVLELPAFGFPAPSLAYARNGGDALIYWNGSAVLQEAPAVTGPWQDILPSATSPYPVTPTGTSRFFRLRLP